MRRIDFQMIKSSEEILKEVKSRKLKKKVNKNHKNQKFLISHCSKHVFLDDLYMALFDGDLFVSIPNGNRGLKGPQSELNVFKKIQKMTIHRKTGFVETFVTSTATPVQKKDKFLDALNSRNDWVYHELAELLREYEDRCQLYKRNIQIQQGDLPLFQSIDNYRVVLQQQLEDFLYHFPEDPIMMFRYYFNPFDKFMHLQSISYNENFLNLMGVTRDQYLKMVNEIGIVNFLHPNSQLLFMVQCLQHQLGKLSRPLITGLDIVTFDDYTIPIEMTAFQISGKPNEDGYFETYFILRTEVKPHILKSLHANRAKSLTVKEES